MSPIIAFLAMNPDFSWPTATEWFSGHQTRPFLFIAAFVDFLSRFIETIVHAINTSQLYCVCIPYSYCMARLGGPGPSCPVLTGPSYPIHTSADFFTFTHNPLISLPFSMKVIENVYSCKCISTSHWLNITRWTC